MLHCGGLRKFWDCLDKSKKEDLLSIKLSSIVNVSACKGCRDMIERALISLKNHANCKCCHVAEHPELSILKRDINFDSIEYVRKSSSVILVKLMCNSVKTSFSTLEKQQSNCMEAFDFVHYISSPNKSSGSERSSYFRIIQESFLRKSIDRVDSMLFEAKNTDSTEDSALLVPWIKSKCQHCEDRLNLRFIDMLTYPKPVNKFRLILNPYMKVKELWETLSLEAGVDASEMVLIHKGKMLSFAHDNKTLLEMNFSSDSMIGISRKLGKVSSSDDTAKKNASFVGDLLFGDGQQCSHQHCDGAFFPSHADCKKGQLKYAHAFKVLSEALHSLTMTRLSKIWLADLKARCSAEELIASLNCNRTEDHTKKCRNKKKKDRGKKKNNEKEFTIEHFSEESRGNELLLSEVRKSKKQSTGCNVNQKCVVVQMNPHATEMRAAVPSNTIESCEKTKLIDRSTGPVQDKNAQTLVEITDAFTTSTQSPVHLLLNKKSCRNSVLLPRLEVASESDSKWKSQNSNREFMDAFYGWCGSCGTEIDKYRAEQCSSCKRPPSSTLPFFKSLHGSSSGTDRDDSVAFSFFDCNGIDEHFLHFLDICGIELKHSAGLQKSIARIHPF